MRAQDIVPLIKDAYSGWSRDEASRLAAALAFYAIFSFAPLLIIVIELAAFVLGGSGHHHVVRDEILGELRPAIGTRGTDALSAIISATFAQRSQGTLAAAAGWIIFAVAATGFIAAIEDALNTVWNVVRPKGIVAMLIDRAKSFLVIAAVAVVSVGLVAVTAALNLLGSGLLPQALSVAVTVIVTVALAAAVYKWLPKTALQWSDVFAGALTTGVLTVAGQYVIGWYLGRSAATSTFGAAGSLVAVLLWLYYSAQIFLFGAEMTKAYAHRHGSKRGPKTRAQTGTVARPRFSRVSSP